MLAQSRTLALQIETLRSTRDLLLPRLLSGQIDIPALSVDETDSPSTNVY